MIGAILRLAIFLAAFLALVCQVRAAGDWTGATPELREWFNSVRSPKGVLCCSFADGHRTEYAIKDGKYWVPIDGEWMPVPADTVVTNAGNPTGGAVVWYLGSGANAVIRCFVPGAFG